MEIEVINKSKYGRKFLEAEDKNYAQPIRALERKVISPDLKSFEKLAVNVKTKEDLDNLMRFYEDRGVLALGGYLPTSCDFIRDRYENETCVDASLIDTGERVIFPSYMDKSWCIENGYSLASVEEYLGLQDIALSEFAKYTESEVVEEEIFEEELAEVA